MRRVSLTAAALLATTSLANAGGIDRSGQGVNILFEEGNHAQLTFSRAMPDVTSSPIGPFPAGSDGARDFNQASFGYKHKLNDKFDLAIIVDQPYGAHISYSDGPFAGGFADIDSTAITGLVQYHIDDNFSVHGGIRALTVEGELQTGLGLLQADSDYDFGGVVGVAYERKDIALRVALTYSSAITSDLSGTNAFFPDGFDGRNFDVEFPESVNLDFQTGIAADTLLFGSIRWVGWDGFNLTTDEDGEWVSFDEDTVTYTLGIGRQITDQLSLAVTIGHEPDGRRPGTTALAPTNGYTSVGFGGTYQATDQVSISGGVSYSKLGSQTISGVTFEDNDAWGAGIRLGYSF
ncbi:MAG: transporter [Pseudoruegeria sp.]